MEFIISGILLAFIICLLIYSMRFNVNKYPSIPYATYKSYPFIGHLCAFLYDRGTFLMDCKQRYGLCFKIRLVNERLTIVGSPSDWATINRNPSFYMPSLDNIMHIFDVSANLYSHPEFDADVHRQYIQYLRNREGLRPMVGEFVRQIRKQMQREKRTLSNDGIASKWMPVGLLQLSHRMLFQPITMALFGEIDPMSLEHDFRVFDDKIQYFSAALPSWMYSWFLTKAQNARSRLNSVWSTTQYASCESELIHARTTLLLDNHDWLSEKDRGGLQTSLFWGSLGNTIPALFWCLFYILQDINALRAIKEEIHTHLPIFSLDGDEDDSAIELWSLEQLNLCIHLDSAINETLRLVAGTILTRKCRQETNVVLQDGRTLPVKPSETVAYFAPLTHLDSNLFSQPDKFIFDRFIDKNADNTVGFVPFGNGKSMCPGRFFAKTDMKVCLALFVRYMEFQFPDPIIVPTQQRHRVGFGVAPPTQDLSVMYRYCT